MSLLCVRARAGEQGAARGARLRRLADACKRVKCHQAVRARAHRSSNSIGACSSSRFEPLTKRATTITCLLNELQRICPNHFGSNRVTNSQSRPSMTSPTLAAAAAATSGVAFAYSSAPEQPGGLDELLAARPPERTARLLRHIRRRKLRFELVYPTTAAAAAALDADSTDANEAQPSKVSSCSSHSLNRPTKATPACACRSPARADGHARARACYS